jgi:hypothetical protein
MGNVTLFASGEATGNNDSARTYAAKGGVRMGWQRSEASPRRILRHPAHHRAFILADDARIRRPC